MRNHQFIKGEFYHIYIHAIEGRNLFNNTEDYERFITTLFAANGTKPVPRIEGSNYLNLVWDIRDGDIDVGEEMVDIVGFCCNPTHAHLVLGEREEGNISRFMHKSQVSYAKYYNIKHDRRGHLFERNFNSKHLQDNEYLLSVSCYVHLNPKDTKEWSGKEYLYPWSSYQDYAIKNRWGRLLKTDIVLSQFNNNDEYKLFVEQYKDGDLEEVSR